MSQQQQQQGGQGEAPSVGGYLDKENHYVPFYPNDARHQTVAQQFFQFPAVALGLTATVASFFGGMWAVKTGNTKVSNLMMRFRVGAQALTIGALVLSTAMLLPKTLRKDREQAIRAGEEQWRVAGGVAPPK
ncbi:HIG1 domain member 2A, variant 2 [Balamuthia mandrillaris]